MDRATGAQLRIATITFDTHEEARKAVEKEKGKNFSRDILFRGARPHNIIMINAETGTEKDDVRVVLERDGTLLKLLLQLHDELKKEKEKAKLAVKAPTTNSVAEAQRPTSSRSNAPSEHGSDSRRPNDFIRSGLRNELSARSGMDTPKHPRSYDARRPPIPSMRAQPMRQDEDHRRSRPGPRDYDYYHRPTTRVVTREARRSPSRSPPPSGNRQRNIWEGRTQEEKEKWHKSIMDEIARNPSGRDYLFIDIKETGYCNEEDVKAVFDKFLLRKVRSHLPCCIGSLLVFYLGLSRSPRMVCHLQGKWDLLTCTVVV